MPDIIVTIAKDKIEEESQKAAESFESRGLIEYSRVYPLGKAPPVSQGSKVFIVKDGFVRGYFVVHEVKDESYPVIGMDKVFDETSTVIFDIHSWQSIEPIAMTGFPNFKYVPDGFTFTRVGNGCFDLCEKV